MAMALESLFHAALDQLPNVHRARRRTEWFRTPQIGFNDVKLALRSVGHGLYYDFTKFPTALPEALVGKGVRLGGGAVMDTTTHGFKQSPRLKEMRDLLKDGDEVEGDDGVIRLNADDIADLRAGTPRGLNLLDRITQREVTTANVGTDTIAPSKKNKATQAPLNVRMTRAAVAGLRTAETDVEEQRRRRIARALAQLAV
jgi:hypothetical protein